MQLPWLGEHTPFPPTQAALGPNSDAPGLLADFGFAPRHGFFSELADRLRLNFLPGTPETGDLGELFLLIFDDERDPEWIAAIDDRTLQRCADDLTRALSKDPLNLRLKRFADTVQALILCQRKRTSDLAPLLEIAAAQGVRVAALITDQVKGTQSLIPADNTSDNMPLAGKSGGKP